MNLKKLSVSQLEQARAHVQEKRAELVAKLEGASPQRTERFAPLVATLDQRIDQMSAEIARR